MLRSRKILMHNVVLFSLILSAGTTAKAYEVYSCWTSENGWGETASTFNTNAERVYFNVAASFYYTFITNKWYRPDGTEEDDTGTNLLTNPVYEEGVFVGFWTYMVIKGENREQGRWRVEHWALDVHQGWQLMCTTYFTITSFPAVPLLPLLLDDDF